MDCPYCAEPVKDSAVVCRSCGRDLFVIRPLMEKLDAATRRLTALEQAWPGRERPELIVRPPRAPALPGLERLAAMACTLILLVFAHFLIIVELNLPLIYLRIVSIMVPFAFGLLCRETGRPRLGMELLSGAIVAVLALLAMSTVVSKLDRVPVLPQFGYEWREFAEYGASITLGFFAGVVVRQTVIAVRSAEAPNRLIAMLARAVSEKLGGQTAGWNMRTLQSMISAAVAAGSALGSVVTGLRQFF